MDIYEQRFWKRVDKNGPIPEHVPGLGRCWIWTAAKTGSGYGAFALRGNQLMSAHRYSFTLHFGPIPDDRPQVLHKCDNRACVRPDHLFAGTQADNLKDAIEKKRLILERPCGPEKRRKIKRALNRPEIKKKMSLAHMGQQSYTKLNWDIVRKIRRIAIPRDREYGFSALARQYGVTRGTIWAVYHNKTWIE